MITSRSCKITKSIKCKTARREYTTSKKIRFFDAYNARHLEEKTLKQMCKNKNVSIRTAEDWLRRVKQLKLNEEKKERRTRSQYTKLNRSTKLTSEYCKWLCFIENDWRDWSLKTQIDKLSLNVHVRTIQRSLLKYTNNARMHIKLKIKVISQKNKRERKSEYVDVHEDHTINNYWKYVIFTNEGHIDGSITPGQRVLCEEDTRLQSENLQEMLDTEEVFLHYFEECNWLIDLLPLTWYNCKKNSSDVKIKKKLKSRRRSTRETQEEYEERVRDWEVRQSHEPEVAERENSMTQQYYKDNLLPDILNSYDEIKRTHDRTILQKNNDASHDTRFNKIKKVNNVCETYRKKRDIETLKHSAQFLDLNAFETINNIIKKRVLRSTKSRNIKTQLKKLVEGIYYSITLNEGRARIEEMPWRCKEVRKREGKAVKSYLWW